MSTKTRSQRLAQAAFTQIAIHTRNCHGKPDKEFVSTVKKFPALIHTCGLAQAVAFALAKKDTEFIDYLAAVLRESGHSNVLDHRSLDQLARTSELSAYLRLSRDAIDAASWLKRYVEAAGEDA